MDNKKKPPVKSEPAGGLESNVYTIMAFVRRWNDWIVILLNAEMILLSCMSTADAEIDRMNNNTQVAKPVFISEDMCFKLSMLYLNFLAIKQIMMAMFYDSAFSRAQGAAKLFTIDLSGKEPENPSNTYGSPFIAVANALVSYLTDATVLSLIAWGFGASALTSLG